jgi:hypothetical protein
MQIVEPSRATGEEDDALKRIAARAEIGLMIFVQERRAGPTLAIDIDELPPPPDTRPITLPNPDPQPRPLPVPPLPPPDDPDEV